MDNLRRNGRLFASLMALVFLFGMVSPAFAGLPAPIDTDELAEVRSLAEKRAEVPRALVDAHVGAIRAALIQNIRSDTDMVGRELVEELERQVIARVGADG
jgi:hypothetical protein